MVFTRRLQRVAELSITYKYTTIQLIILLQYLLVHHQSEQHQAHLLITNGKFRLILPEYWENMLQKLY